MGIHTGWLWQIALRGALAQGQVTPGDGFGIDVDVDRCAALPAKALTAINDRSRAAEWDAE